MAVGVSVFGVDGGGLAGMVKYRVHPVCHPGRDTFLLLELNGRWQDQARVGGGVASDSGGHVLYVSPGVQFLLRRNLILEGEMQVPVLHELNGTQLAPTRARSVRRSGASILRRPTSGSG